MYWITKSTIISIRGFTHLCYVLVSIKSHNSMFKCCLHNNSYFLLFIATAKNFTFITKQARPLRWLENISCKYCKQANKRTLDKICPELRNLKVTPSHMVLSNIWFVSCESEIVGYAERSHEFKQNNKVRIFRAFGILLFSFFFYLKCSFVLFTIMNNLIVPGLVVHKQAEIALNQKKILSETIAVNRTFLLILTKMFDQACNWQNPPVNFDFLDPVRF